MNKHDYSTSILVDAAPDKAFKNISNFRAWWSEEIEGNTDQLNETFFYHYKDIHLCKMKLVEAIPGKKLVYKVLENEFSFISDQSEWVNSELVFEIIPKGEKTKVVFTHKGLTPEDKCYQVCNDAWTNYITDSLYNLIQNDKGKPNPKEGEGLNAQLAKKWKID